MTASKMVKKIRKTREHTSRLMKKLWKEGYRERLPKKTVHLQSHKETYKRDS
jgi:CRP-like cAMP-binding protein